jgi:predicted secreted protein
MSGRKMGRRVFIASSAAAVMTSVGSGQASKNHERWGVSRIDRNLSSDGRSMKVVFVAHCALNQNSRHVDCADFPAMFEGLLEGLRSMKVGIVQMPCPEFTGIGLARDWPKETIRESLDDPVPTGRLQEKVDEIIYQIREYRRQKVHVVGILGKNGSPSCAVERRVFDNGHVATEGVFIRLLREALERENLTDVGLKGLDDHRQEEAVEWVRSRLSA